MKCPSCGKEMKEGNLICEACGNEIQIVPDFELEIENSITETLSTLAALQDEEETVNEEPDIPDINTKEAEKKKTGRRRKVKYIVAAVIVLLLMVSGYSLYVYHIGTVSYQIDKAKEYAAQGLYEQAIAYLDIAYEKDDTQAQILFLKADYYYLMFHNESAVQALKQVIDSGIYSYEEIEEAYGKIIAIYKQEERYEDINELLLACQEDAIVNMFQGYLAKAPEFSYVEGNYAEVIPLKLSSNTSGTIYYTTDGSTPDESSQVYTAPLFLENGDYTIKAFFVNDYGIKSEIVSKTYHVSLEVPNAPEVTLYSGEYTEPMMITVTRQAGCTTYYTTDGSDPDKDSVPYTGPIPMPLGTTQFKFININKEGVASDVMMRTYTLALQDTISTQEAVDRLIDRLVETGYLASADGRAPQQNGVYSYQVSSVLRIGEDVYFTIYEYYDDGTGIVNRMDKVFLVQAYTGAVARLGYDEDGAFAASPI
ncbi:MAG: chitobiase/beta-hexosaminidase C-terminal domain-containing protein [Muribaculaceae bacterium]|nr:chitobiase/beta-hexosaminidase C-terminal domain-containing protein [Muribaculaceae bacterium]